jgi:hypothetical protein
VSCLLCVLGAHKKIVPSSVHVFMPLCCRHKSHLVLALSARCMECMGTEEEQVQAGAAARRWWAKLFAVHPRMTPPESTYVCDIPSSTLRVCFFMAKDQPVVVQAVHSGTSVLYVDKALQARCVMLLGRNWKVSMHDAFLH